jgi:hypothetical protein
MFGREGWWMFTGVSEVHTASSMQGQYQPPKRRSASTRLLGATFRVTAIFTLVVCLLFIGQMCTAWRLLVCSRPSSSLMMLLPRSVAPGSAQWWMSWALLLFNLVEFVPISFFSRHTCARTCLHNEWALLSTRQVENFAIINCSAAWHCEAHNGPAHLLLDWSHPLKAPVCGGGEMGFVRYLLIDFNKSLLLFFLNSL